VDIAGFRFEEPWWLLGMLLGPALALLRLFDEAQRPALAFPGVGRLRPGTTGWGPRVRGLPFALAVAALMVGFVALARPQHGTLKQDVTTQGVDIVVALDVSGSMAAEDFQPRNRLEVAKRVVAEFVERRRNDRIGLVVFAAKSLTKAPPTTDQGVLLRQLDDVRLDMLPDGTAIGSGVATALTRLRHSRARSRIVVLVTDGGNNAGEIDPATASDLARAMEVRVYTVGVGSQGEVPMPVKAPDPLTGVLVRRTVPMEVKFDEELLKRIAAQTGGEFFRASDPESLRHIFDRIDRLEKSEIHVTAYRRYRELFPPYLVVALVLLAGAGVAWLAGLRVIPV
jgi:Ca-activated chloride channel homolog